MGKKYEGLNNMSLWYKVHGEENEFDIEGDDNLHFIDTLSLYKYIQPRHLFQARNKDFIFK